MQFQIHHVLVSVALLALAPASPTHKLDADEDSSLKGKRYVVERDGVIHNIFEHDGTGSSMDYVQNSGICETSAGVNQYSGYFSVGKNMSMWFWFFEARNGPRTAPLALWMNGGPGCSSMIGLFQENGPCYFVDNSSTPSLNPYSWNEYANMLYVDQPIGTGFSYGNDTVIGTVSAAPYVWKFLQAFFARFPEYETRDFGLFTESYGGHYGPEFASYFETQNAAICEGDGYTRINLVALGINNGWYDAKIQEREFINFSRYNSYFPLINQSVHTAYLAAYTAQCLPALENCTSPTGDIPQCFDANNACNDMDDSFGIYYPDIDPYDIRQPGTSAFPSETYVDYLLDPAVMKRIGAQTSYVECSDAVGMQFHSTGDNARSFLPALSSVVQSGITTLIWAGDADSVCDWFGGLACVNAIDYADSEAFQDVAVCDYTVRGEVKGTYKSVGNLSWLRVFESGHEVAAFQPELALQVFRQTMQRKAIFST